MQDTDVYNEIKSCFSDCNWIAFFIYLLILNIYYIKKISTFLLI